MAVPRNRLSNARKNSKRSHHAKKPKGFTACPKCEAPRVPHTICQGCGSYGDRTVLSIQPQA
ncbi:MAG TPA: 50S ribosomal protein L32 [Parachlamydiaceae bacterium]|nr:50S ribosomal protein L32 [Parachlamydiaceae bacterium]